MVAECCCCCLPACLLAVGQEQMFLQVLAEEKLAAEHNFRLLRLPIGTLFPQPAPAWIWSGDQEPVPKP